MRVSWFIVSLVFFSMTAPLVANGGEETSVPDMDLIEFLGGWETEDGDWIDPFLFDDRFQEETFTDVEEDGKLVQEDLGQTENDAFGGHDSLKKNTGQRAGKNDSTQ